MWRGLTRFGQRLGRGEVSRRYLAKIPSNESLKPFYALGLNIGGQTGHQLKGLLSPEEMKVMLDGFNDFMNNEMENEHEIMRKYGGPLNAILQGRMDAGVAAMEQQRQEFVNNYLKEFPGAFQTDTGLVYQEIEAGTGDSPASTSTVRVHYHGKFLDGKVFDSSLERGEPVSFPLNQVIQGWQEGLQLMKVGGKGQFVIPSELAYGDKGAPPTIPPSATLVFDVQLLAIE